jgi:ubiquinone/menaquinone biosynthesis C-methylase UbiE
MDSDEHQQRVARHFDQNPAGYAEAYLNVSSPSAFYFRRRQSIVMRLLRVLDGGLVLDLGCGPGMYAEPCIAQGLRYYGIDIARGAIAEARKQYGQLQQAKFEVGDAKQLPFPSNSVGSALPRVA